MSIQIRLEKSFAQDVQKGHLVIDESSVLIQVGQSIACVCFSDNSLDWNILECPLRTIKDTENLSAVLGLVNKVVKRAAELIGLE
jgi:hypothetical protein